MLNLILLKVHWSWDLILLLAWGAFVFLGGITLFFYNDHLRKKYKTEQIPNGYDVILTCLDALSSEKPEEPGPYSGQEWSCSDGDCSPTVAEVSGADQVSSGSEAASSSPHEGASAPSSRGSAAPPAHGAPSGFPPFPHM